MPMPEHKPVRRQRTPVRRRELAHDGTHDSGNPKATGRSTALQPRYTNWYYYFSGQFKDADN